MRISCFLIFSDAPCAAPPNIIAILLPTGLLLGKLASESVRVTLIEPRLGMDRPTMLYRYPVCEAALARACEDDPRFADRFELYVCGVELANGFHELTDPTEQRARFEADMQLKQQLYGETYPIDEDFLASLEHMPDASGVALGFDRLVMLATGAPSINHVLWTPFQ